MYSGHGIRMDVEGSITLSQLRDRMAPVYGDFNAHGAGNGPLAECKLIYIKPAAKNANMALGGPSKVDLADGSKTLAEYGVLFNIFSNYFLKNRSPKRAGTWS